jgi:hypothetical protein
MTIFLVRMLQYPHAGSFERSHTSWRKALLSAFSPLLFPLAFASPVCGQNPPDQPAAETAIVRPCPVPPSNSKSERKDKAKPKDAPATMTETVPGCLEAKATALEIQEYLQSFVRDQRWKIADEKSGEDGWTFSRYLDKDELVRFKKEEAFTGRVIWRDGKAFVQVSTSTAAGGFTRVQVAVKLQGYGENGDHFAPPQDSWQLMSNGTLESNIIAALDTHFKSLH